MKLQNLCIIFVVIVLPISIILTAYTKNRVETINIQAQYDSKLNDATHDALKAYQINSYSNETSDLTNAKINDIKASVNTFFNSLSSNFSSLGYTKSSIQDYVPALVYTMYDGYYIYSKYTNTWDNDTIQMVQDQESEIIAEEEAQYGVGASTYVPDFVNGEDLYGLKPYVYYSCRYKVGTETDVVITYSLDNYIQIQGRVRMLDGTIKTVSRYGYLLSDVQKDGNNYRYKGTLIPENEGTLRENMCKDDTIYKNVPYIKKNGARHYINPNNSSEVISNFNGTYVTQNLSNGNAIKEIEENRSAKMYYEESLEMKDFIMNSDLKDLSTRDIVDLQTGERYGTRNDNPYITLDKIFDFGNGEGIESERSNFNTHRMDVIRYSIERNLSIAISNYNHYSSSVTTDFQMPKLKEIDWDKIMDNISIISFFQGANIGGKIYNGYSIITNTKNEDVVMEDSIYIKTSDSNGNIELRHITDTNLNDSNAEIGVLNVNTEIRQSPSGQYYMPVTGKLSYDSIIMKNNVAEYNGNLMQYIDSLSPKLRTLYYTALGRERYSLYRQKLEI